jgi:hypothetical protein
MSARLGTPAAMAMEPSLDPPEFWGDDEPLTEEDARYEAGLELMTNIGGCLDTIRNAAPNDLTHSTVDGEWLADEAGMGECVAVLLQSQDDQHIAAAAYRLRSLIELSKDGQEFIASRAKELLDEETQRHDDAMAQAQCAIREAA